jgi:hypothetical protein
MSGTRNCQTAAFFQPFVGFSVIVSLLGSYSPLGITIEEVEEQRTQKTQIILLWERL